MANSIIQIGVNADISSIKAGMVEAAAIVNSSTQQMGNSFKKLAAETEFSMAEAKGSLALLSEEVGVKIPRHLRGFIAEIGGVGGALNAAFAGFAVVALVEVLTSAGEKLTTFYESLGELSASEKKAYEDAMKEAKGRLDVETNILKAKYAEQIASADGLTKERLKLQELTALVALDARYLADLEAQKSKLEAIAKAEQAAADTANQRMRDSMKLGAGDGGKMSGFFGLQVFLDTKSVEGAKKEIDEKLVPALADANLALAEAKARSIEAGKALEDMANKGRVAVIDSVQKMLDEMNRYDDTLRQMDNDRVKNENAIENKQVENIKARTEQILKEKQREVTEARKLATGEIDYELAADKERIRSEEAYYQDLYAMGQLNSKQLLAIKLKEIRDEEQLEVEALQRRIATLDPQDIAEKQRLENQIKLIHQKSLDDQEKAERKHQMTMMERWKQVGATISGAFHTSIQGIIMGTQTFAQAMGNILNSILAAFVDMLVQMAIQWVTTHIFMALFKKATTTATAESSIMASAAEAGAAGTASWAGAPWPIDAYAPAFGASMFAAAAAYAGAGFFEKGGIVPENMPAFLHANEMVLPAPISQKVQSMVAGGAGGKSIAFNYSPTVNALDARGVATVLKDHKRELFKVIRRGIQMGELRYT